MVQGKIGLGPKACPLRLVSTKVSELILLLWILFVVFCPFYYNFNIVLIFSLFFLPRLCAAIWQIVLP